MNKEEIKKGGGEKMNKEEIEKAIEEKKKEIEELEKQLQEMQEEIAIQWESQWTDRRKHGKPYLAIITKNGEGGKKYNYEFLPCVEETKKDDVKSYWKGTLKIGTIVRARIGGSWKNDYAYFYIVEKEGLKEIKEKEVMEKLGLI